MNINSLIALLELKGIITRDEGEKLVEYINNKPQSTMLADAVHQVKAVLDDVEETAKTVAEQAKEEIEKLAADVKAEVKADIAKDTASVKKSVDKSKK